MTFIPRSEPLAAARLARLVSEPLLEEAARRGGLRLRRRLADRPIARGAHPAPRQGGVGTLAVRYVLHSTMRSSTMLDWWDITRTAASRRHGKSSDPQEGNVAVTLAVAAAPTPYSSSARSLPTADLPDTSWGRTRPASKEGAQPSCGGPNEASLPLGGAQPGIDAA